MRDRVHEGLTFSGNGLLELNCLPHLLDELHIGGTQLKERGLHVDFLKQLSDLRSISVLELFRQVQFLLEPELGGVY